MKNLIWFIALSLVLSACGKEEPAAPAEDTAAAVAEAPETGAEEAVTADDEGDDEALEVVEESASEPEPDDADESIVLAMADDATPPHDWQFEEGKNFTRLVPTQPTVGGPDKIEVAEFFWYGCPHCYDMESYINRWAENKDPGVRFVYVPALFNNLYRLHAQLYYTEEVLERNGVIKDPTGFRAAVFEEYHQRGNRLTSQAAIARLFARFGVSEDEFNRTWNSFEVNQKLRVAEDLARRYSITSVPAIVVNGKYRTNATQAGGYPKLMEVIDELVERERLR